MTQRWGAEPDERSAEESRILERARADPSAFAPLYEAYFPRIYGYCLRRVGNAEEAEDLASTVFTRALTGLGGYRGGSVAAWLFRIAHNTVANHYRDHPRHAPPSDTLETTEDPAAGDQMLERLVRDEEHARVARLIAALPEQQRELLALKVTGRLSAREIGAVVGRSEGAVRVALHRIVQGLRAAYRQTERE